MRAPIVAAVTVVACVCTALALTMREAPADSPRRAPPPRVVLLEGSPDGEATQVVVRALAGAAQPEVLGVVPHVAGSARRGTLSRDGRAVFVVAAERASRRGSTYESALWRVARGVDARRLLGGLTDASRPVLTARGELVVQRGRDGDEPVDDGSHTLRERVDALTLEVVDPDNGAARVAWSGRGMIAFPACAMGDEVIVYHVHEAGASLFALDPGAGAARPVVPAMEPLARDFSCDVARAELTFARASPRRDGTWEVVTVSTRRGDVASARVRWRAASDHLAPRALGDGAVVFSIAGDRGLGLLRPWPEHPERLAPLGDGADEALDESPDKQWIALRHRAPGREVLCLHARAAGRTVTSERPDTYTEFVGFARDEVAP